MQSDAKPLVDKEKSSSERVECLKNDSEMIYKGDIMGKVRQTRSDRWKKRPCVLRYWEFKDRLVEQAGSFKLGNSFDIIFYLKMPKSWSKKKKALKLQSIHDQKPDTDNMVKAVADMLLEEDSKIWNIHAYKFWAEESGLYIRNHKLYEQNLAILKYSKGVIYETL